MMKAASINRKVHINQRPADRKYRRILAAVFLLMSWILAVPDALAVPSMGRQTGFECSRCHTVFPELTPFGRQFKLGAFSDSSAKWEERRLLERLPISAALQVSRTATRETAAGGAMPADFPLDKQVIVQTAALYSAERFSTRPALSCSTTMTV